MLAGTAKLFPTDYEKFKNAMIEAAEDNDLPVFLQQDDVKDYTLRDLQDTFYEFERDTGLSIEGHTFLCKDCGQLHLLLEIDYPEEEENKLIQ